MKIEAECPLNPFCDALKPRGEVESRAAEGDVSVHEEPVVAVMVRLEDDTNLRADREVLDDMGVAVRSVIDVPDEVGIVPVYVSRMDPMRDDERGPTRHPGVRVMPDMSVVTMRPLVRLRRRGRGQRGNSYQTGSQRGGSEERGSGPVHPRHDAPPIVPRI